MKKSKLSDTLSHKGYIWLKLQVLRKKSLCLKLLWLLTPLSTLQSEDNCGLVKMQSLCARCLTARTHLDLYVSLKIKDVSSCINL